MFVICVESSHARGLGHLYRGLRLAEALKQRGQDVTFVMNDGHDRSIEMVRSAGLDLRLAPIHDDSSDWAKEIATAVGADVWIDDRLDTSVAHAARLSEIGLRRATFDDRGAGARFADLHIAALALDPAEPLGGRTVLRGADNLLMASEVFAHRRRRTELGRILVTMGGADTWGITPRVVEILANLGLGATVIAGPAFAHHAALERVATGAFDIRGHVPSLIAEMGAHDLAVTAGGVTPFEAIATGLPCIVIAAEPHEEAICAALAKTGAARHAGFRSSIDVEAFRKPFDLAAMSEAALAYIQPGGTDRVVDALLALRAG